MEPKLIVAGIDVHKRMLAVVVVDEDNPKQALVKRTFGSNAGELKHLAAWLIAHGVTQVVMESTAQYWKPVWLALEKDFDLHLAQAQSNAGPGGRKLDYVDALRLARRFLSAELRLSFVPDAEQRSWRGFVAQQVSEETSPSAIAESNRSAAGREPDQTVE